MERQSKGKNILIAVTCFLAGALLSYGIFSFIARRATAVPAPTGTTAGQQNPSQTTSDGGIAADPANLDQNIFTSTSLGISFSYLKYGYSFDENNPGIDRSIMAASPQITGNRITFGQNSSAYLAVYQKDPTQSLEAAIQSQFLAGVPSSSCIITRIRANSDSAIYAPTSTISYVTLHSTVPGGCSAQFDFSNTSATFISFANQPNKFFYFIGNQDGSVPLLTASGAPFWTTMQFLPQ